MSHMCIVQSVNKGKFKANYHPQYNQTVISLKGFDSHSMEAVWNSFLVPTHRDIQTVHIYPVFFTLMPAFTWLLLSTTLRHWSANSINMGSFIALSMSSAGEGEDTRLVIRERRWGFSRVTRRSGFSPWYEQSVDYIWFMKL